MRNRHHLEQFPKKQFINNTTVFEVKIYCYIENHPIQANIYVNQFEKFKVNFYL